MLTPGGTLPDDLVPGRANVLHNVNPENGALTPADGTPMYYPRNTAVDIIAWHTSSTPDDNYILNLNTGDQTSESRAVRVAGDEPPVFVCGGKAVDCTTAVNATGVRLSASLSPSSSRLHDASINAGSVASSRSFL